MLFELHRSLIVNNNNLNDVRSYNIMRATVCMSLARDGWLGQHGWLVIILVPSVSFKEALQLCSSGPPGYSITIAASGHKLPSRVQMVPWVPRCYTCFSAVACSVVYVNFFPPVWGQSVLQDIYITCTLTLSALGALHECMYMHALHQSTLI